MPFTSDEQRPPASANRPKAFLITMDTEGDNLWSKPRTITTENARYLPRFQELCEKYGLKPTWLTNYEMAICPSYREFAADTLRRSTSEVGMHLHAWNSPPLAALTADDFQYQPYLMEYPADVIRDKVHYLTDLLEDTFQSPIVSHRSGRWGLDETYARILAERGYQVDCTVTPHVSWRSMRGAPQGHGGCDYRGFPEDAYALDLDDLSRAGDSPLLEIPMTTRCVPRRGVAEKLRSWGQDSGSGWMRRITQRLLPGVAWFRPDGRNLRGMLRLLDTVAESSADYIMLMLHSSELMPGSSPRFRTPSSIERLYGHLEQVFAAATSRFTGMTLSEYASRVRGEVGEHA